MSTFGMSEEYSPVKALNDNVTKSALHCNASSPLLSIVRLYNTIKDLLIGKFNPWHEDGNVEGSLIVAYNLEPPYPGKNTIGGNVKSIVSLLAVMLKNNKNKLATTKTISLLIE